MNQSSIPSAVTMTTPAPAPPSYDDSTETPNNINLPATEPLSLTIESTFIYLSTPPSNELYELSRALDGSGKIIGVQQIDHKLSSRFADTPAIKCHERQLYDFRPWHELKSVMQITGQRRSCFQSVWMKRGLGLMVHTWSVGVKDVVGKPLTAR